MYCRMCGNILGDTDHYCQHCGTPTGYREETVPSADRSEENEEIVFNPPYETQSHFIEEESRNDSEEPFDPKQGEKEEDLKEFISEKEIEAQKKESSETTEPVMNSEFQWNVYEFPAEKPKKTEEVKFNWNMEEYGPSGHKEAAEEIFEEALFQEIKDESSRIKEQNIDRFFTFSRKNEEFQELLDREYEKFKMRSEPAVEQAEPETPEAHKISAMEPQVKVIKESGIPETVVLQEIKIDEEASLAEAEQTPSPEEASHEEQAPADVEAADAAEIMAGEDLFETPAEVEEPAASEKPEIIEASEVIEEPAAPVEPAEPVTAPKSEHLSEMAKARAQFFGEELVRDNESIRKKLTTEEPGESEDTTEPAEPTELSEPAELAEPTEPDKTEGDSREGETAVNAILAPALSDKAEKKEEVPEEGEKKKRSVAQILLVLIAIILAIEIVILGIYYFAPNSAASKAIGTAQTQIFKTVTGWFSGTGDDASEKDKDTGKDANKDTDQEEEPAGGQTADDDTKAPAPDPNPTADKNALVASQLGNNINIQQVKANEALAYQTGKDYGQTGINNSKPLTNNIWLTPENREPVYYDKSVVGTIIAFDSQWIDYVNSGNKNVLDLLKKDSEAYRKSVSYSKVGKVKETFKLLEIGEIRQGENGFYVWVHEQLQITENGTTADKSYNWIYYLEPVEEKMQIVNYFKF